eukprot:2303619-Prymnesium_polylepis.1
MLHASRSIIANSAAASHRPSKRVIAHGSHQGGRERKDGFPHLRTAAIDPAQGPEPGAAIG